MRSGPVFDLNLLLADVKELKSEVLDEMPSLGTRVLLLRLFNLHKLHLKTFQDIKSTHVSPLKCFSCQGGKASEIACGLTWDI